MRKEDGPRLLGVLLLFVVAALVAVAVYYVAWKVTSRVLLEG